MFDRTYSFSNELLSSAMEANHESTSCFGRVPAGERGGGEVVEIRIKTLDSQSYTLRVEKNVSLASELVWNIACKQW